MGTNNKHNKQNLPDFGLGTRKGALKYVWKRSPRSACASAQADQSLRFSRVDFTLSGLPLEKNNNGCPDQNVWMRKQFLVVAVRICDKSHFAWQDHVIVFWNDRPGCVRFNKKMNWS